MIYLCVDYTGRDEIGKLGRDKLFQDLYTVNRLGFLEAT